MKTSMQELTGKLDCPAEDARRIVPLADGNLTRAVKIFRNDEDELFFLEKFQVLDAALL